MQSTARSKLRVGVVGGTGLVGRHLVEALVRIGADRVVATHRARPNFAAKGVTWVRCDLREIESVRPALLDIDVAVLCAGRVSTSSVLRADPIASVLETLRVVTNVLEVAAELGIRRVILVSSCTGYPALPHPASEGDMFIGDPPHRWFGVGWMHRYLEAQLRWYAEYLGRFDSAISLRPSLIYGPYDDFASETGHFVPAMIRRVVDRECPIEIWGDGTQTRNLLHAADLADAILAVLQGEVRYEAFNVTSRDDVTVNDLLHLLLEIDGFTDAVVKHDLGRTSGAAALSVSGEAFAAAKGWSSRIGFKEGVAATLDWYRRNRNVAP
jgi:nucleoside-diphosphate-sugar epimerase